MDSSIVVITGANSGIGKAATYRFAREGYTVVMACRNADRSIAVRDQIVHQTGNPQIEVLPLDISSLDSIRQFCNTFTAGYPRLDVLINNAAYFNHGSPYAVSSDNIELTFATNVFGPFLLTRLLKDHLKKSGRPIVLNAGSNIIKHFFEPRLKINFDVLQSAPADPKLYRVYNSYRDSKMALLMLNFRLAEEFRQDGIRVNALQINGARMSKETLQKVSPGYRFIARIQNLFFRPPEFMADRYYQICTSETFYNLTGKLFNHKLAVMQPGQAKPGIFDAYKQVLGADLYPPYAHHQETTDKLWLMCQEITQSAFPANP